MSAEKSVGGVNLDPEHSKKELCKAILPKGNLCCNLTLIGGFNFFYWEDHELQDTKSKTTTTRLSGELATSLVYNPFFRVSKSNTNSTTKFQLFPHSVFWQNVKFQISDDDPVKELYMVDFCIRC